jgi:hypothetical protein
MRQNTGKLRKKIDLRLVSFALSVLKDNPDNAELAVAARFLAAASLQLAGGLKALSETCKATSSSQAIQNSMERAQARRCEMMFEALSECLDEHRRGELQELIELIVVFASETMSDDDRHGLVVWAHSLGLSTEPLVMHEDDHQDLPVVEIGDALKKRSHAPRKRTTRSTYREDRYEDIAREAIAKGFKRTTVKMAGSRVRLMGDSPSGLVHLRWLRCSVNEAQELSRELDEELAKMRRTEPARDNVRG